MKVILDLDDFSVLNNRFDLLFKIKEHYPNFKVSMFTIPFDARYETSGNRIYRDKAVETLKENLDWIQIIPHGLAHMPREFEKADKTTTLLALKAIDEVFSKDEIPYEKGFKAPQWLWNREVVEALDSKGWWGAVDVNQPEMPCTNRFYRYSYSLSQPFWESDREVLKLHGHLDGSSDNDLDKCFLGIFKLPTDVEFGFVTEQLENK